MKERAKCLIVLSFGFTVVSFATPGFAGETQAPAAAASPPLAKAPPASTPAFVVAPEHDKPEWYGSSILVPVAILDGLAMPLAVHGILTDGAPLVQAALALTAGRILVAPITHWRHGYVGRGFATLGINLGFSATLAVAGYFIARPFCDEKYLSYEPYYCEEGRIATGAAGFILGGAAATIYDTIKLSYDDSPKHSAKTNHKGLPWTLSAAPIFTPNIVGAGLVGTF